MMKEKYEEVELEIVQISDIVTTSGVLESQDPDAPWVKSIPPV